MGACRKLNLEGKMKNFFITALLLILFLTAGLYDFGADLVVEKKGIETRAIVRLKNLSPNEVRNLAPLHLDIAGVFRNGDVDIVIDPSKIDGLRKLGHELEVRIPDIEADMIAKMGEDRYDFGNYMTYTEVVAALDQLHSDYPSLTTDKINIGTSLEGRTIWAMKVSDNPSVNDPGEADILYNGVHHAREPIGASLCVLFAEYLCDNYGVDSHITDLVDATEAWIVPVVNPDGYVYNEGGGGGWWRKNRRNNGDGTWGVDPNRNYGYQWGYDNNGSSPYTGDEDYRGPYAFSEPCTQAMRDFFNAHEFVFSVDYHSYGNLLLYPWGYVNQPTPDEDFYVSFLNYWAGYNGYAVGRPGELLYNVNGGSIDWEYGEQTSKPKCFGLSPEAGEDFWQDSQINQHFAENKDGMLHLLELAAFPMVRYHSHEVADGGNGWLDPDETADLVLTLDNPGIRDATNVRVTLTETDPYIDFPDDTADFGDIAGMSSADNSADPFSAHADASTPMGYGAQVTVQITADGGYSHEDTLLMTVGAPDTLFFDDMESGNSGWTHGGTYDEWTLGNPAGSGSSSDPGSAYSPSNVWGTDLGSSGDYEDYCDQWLQTPALDCSNYTGVTLQYYRYLNVEKGQWDHAMIYVNGILVWENGYSSDHRDSSWQLHEIDISSYADGEASVTIRWELDADSYINYGGWNIDDVLVTGYITSSNTAPVLSNPSFTPASGYYGTRFEFNVDYDDADGDAPALIQVNIDGIDYDMTLDSGSPANGTYRYRTRDIAQDETHAYYFFATDGNGGSDRNPVSGTLGGPATYDPELFISGTPGPGAWMTLEAWGCVDALWGAAWSMYNGPFYLPASGLTYDVGPGNLHLAKKMVDDPVNLDEFGYGTKDFQLPAHVSSGTKYIQATTKMNAFWAKTNFETFIVP